MNVLVISTMQLFSKFNIMYLKRFFFAKARHFQIITFIFSILETKTNNTMHMVIKYYVIKINDNKD